MDKVVTIAGIVFGNVILLGLGIRTARGFYEAVMKEPANEVGSMYRTAFASGLICALNFGVVCVTWALQIYILVTG